VAVVLFNLGGPDGPAAVEPFLRNLFSDPAIIGLPGPLRRFVAGRIARRRAPIAREIYEQLGGGSPLLANTRAQAAALEHALAGGADQVRVFIAMRYWHPMSKETAADVAAFAPDEVVLLPLYPQFSTTTTGSSLTAWQAAATAAGVGGRTRALCCYPQADGFIRTVADLTRAGIETARAAGRPRVLFTAHGLPKRVVARGDPYQWQVEQTAAATARALMIDGLDWVVCYQSRVGPLEWIGPETEAEIRRAGEDGVPAVVVPIAFVSEHSETLVELDRDYRRVADEAGVPAYVRVATVDTRVAFVEALADLVRLVLASEEPVSRGGEGRVCPVSFGRCALAGAR